MKRITLTLLAALLTVTAAHATEPEAAPSETLRSPLLSYRPHGDSIPTAVPIHFGTLTAHRVQVLISGISVDEAGFIAEDWNDDLPQLQDALETFMARHADLIARYSSLSAHRQRHLRRDILIFIQDELRQHATVNTLRVLDALEERARVIRRSRSTVPASPAFPSNPEGLIIRF